MYCSRNAELRELTAICSPRLEKLGEALLHAIDFFATSDASWFLRTMKHAPNSKNGVSDRVTDPKRTATEQSETDIAATVPLGTRFLDKHVDLSLSRQRLLRQIIDES